MARADQGPDGERRPRRRGRRGGRRRRGGPEDGSGRIDRGRTRADIGAGSNQRGRRFRRIFRRAGPGGCSARTGGAAPAPEPPASPTTLSRSRSRRERPANPRPPRRAEGAAARRRSTVREKVSFLSSAQPKHRRPSRPASLSRRHPAPAQTAARDRQPTPSRARPAGGRGASAAANRPQGIFRQKNRPAKPVFETEALGTTF